MVIFYDSEDKLFLIAEIKNKKMLVSGYGVRVGDSINKIDGWESKKVDTKMEEGSKIDLSDDIIVSFEGVSFDLDEGNKIKSISIFSIK